MDKQDKQQLYEDLRKKYPVFVFHDFNYTLGKHSLKAEFTFELPGSHSFKPTLDIPHRDFIDPSGLGRSDLDNLVFHIGLVELVSYWKATCSPKVIIRPFRLSDAQIKWWKKLYLNGLGEFFYLNGLRPVPDDFMDIVTEGEAMPLPFRKEMQDKYLIPLGGGKDSIVTLELLKQVRTIHPFIINTRGATMDTAAKAGYGPDDIFEIRRSIHPQLLKLNDEGFLNGHTPFSALIAFSTLLAAGLTGFGNIALSNEASADEATIKGTNINHQYSKTFEFEQDFREYVSAFITPDINYFSFLRPLHELQIAKLFSGYPQYFDVFKSCNAGSRSDTWCGHCAKCLFTFIILSPFVNDDVRKKIFGYDLFDNADLAGIFDELNGTVAGKPFECIGTIDEVNLALCMTIRQFAEDRLPYLLKRYRESALYKRYNAADPRILLNSVNPRHFLSSELLNLITERI
jgi:UDP-N-acetyl-alpha-D-muramoyl-L-alanyl-L-glutamate epimerase